MSNRAELMPVEPQAVASAPAVMTPAHMLQIAVERGADLDQLQRFMDLNDRWQAAQAKKSYDAAFAAFKANPPKLVKNKHVSFPSKNGGSKTDYWHATLDHILDETVPLLAAHGFTHRWKTSQEGGRITVTCTLTHVDGHSESETLSSGLDDSGNKNSIQQMASARSYLERHTFMGITGQAAGDDDDDGNAAGGDAECIGPGQVADLEALLTEVGANRQMFLRYCKVESLDQIKVQHYQAAVAALVAKRKS